MNPIYLHLDRHQNFTQVIHSSDVEILRNYKSNSNSSIADMTYKNNQDISNRNGR